MTGEGGYSLVTLIDADGEEARGDGIYPLYPTMKDGRAVLNPGEETLAKFRGRKLHLGTTQLSDSIRVDVRLTNQRLVFEVVKWKWEADLRDTMALKSSGVNLAMAGHLPLESIFAVDYGGRYPLVRLIAVSRTDSGANSGRVEILWGDTEAEVERFGRATITAAKGRWSEHDLPDDLQQAVQAQEPTIEETRKSWGRKAQLRTYRGHAALLVGTSQVFSPRGDYTLFPEGDPIKLDAGW